LGERLGKTAWYACREEKRREEKKRGKKRRDIAEIWSRG
jgi:hypothetical protein